MKIDIATRTPIWIALSELYLDTELQDADYKTIARIIVESAYTIDEVKKINKYEVFPVLYQNLLSAAGVWNGFDKEWLVAEIIKSINKRTQLKTLNMAAAFTTQKSQFKEAWKKIEKNLDSIP